MIEIKHLKSLADDFRWMAYIRRRDVMRGFCGRNCIWEATAYEAAARSVDRLIEAERKLLKESKKASSI